MKPISLGVAKEEICGYGGIPMSEPVRCVAKMARWNETGEGAEWVCNQPIRQREDGSGWDHVGDCGTCGHFENHHGRDTIDGYCFTCIDWNPPGGRRCTAFVSTVIDRGHPARPSEEVLNAAN